MSEIRSKARHRRGRTAALVVGLPLTLTAAAGTTAYGSVLIKSGAGTCSSIGTTAHAKTAAATTLTVAKDGRGQYTGVRKAVDAVPANKERSAPSRHRRHRARRHRRSDPSAPAAPPRPLRRFVRGLTGRTQRPRNLTGR